MSSRAEFLRGRPLYLGHRPDGGCPKCDSNTLDSHGIGHNFGSYECEEGYEFRCICGFEWVEILKDVLEDYTKLHSDVTQLD